MSKIDITKCLADDFGKYRYHFFEKYDKLDIEHCKYIYNGSNLPDPDAFSEVLYDYCDKLWNSKYPTVPKVKKIFNKDTQTWELVGIQNSSFRLGTDSIMNIYWHKFSKRQMVKQIIQNQTNIPFKDYIRQYLMKANTIGGFIVFAKHPNSVNQKRGFKSFFG